MPRESSRERDLRRLVEQAGQHLRARRLRLATAESCTGGLVAATCTAATGASDWFDCGFVTYSPGAKVRLLGVAAATLQAHGAVSEPVCAEMALGALARSGAGIAVAVTGLAGPGGGELALPVGTVWIGWSMLDGGAPAVAQTSRFQFDGARAQVVDRSVRAALEGIVELLEPSAPKEPRKK